MHRLGLPRRSATITVALVLGLISRIAVAQPIALRFATLAPPASAWWNAVANGWAHIATSTKQRVDVAVYASGLGGDQHEVVNFLIAGKLDMAELSGVGLEAIDPSMAVLQLPRIFSTADELSYVADKMWPYFQAKFLKAGFRLANRIDLGWAYLLTRSKVTSLSNFRTASIWREGADGMVRAVFDTLGLASMPLDLALVRGGLVPWIGGSRPKSVSRAPAGCEGRIAASCRGSRRRSSSIGTACSDRC
ncbi:MAG: TRAP transporter substrate-binding protein DctP, partial [Deltaproteobacteria bacterium]|nr:TRAP transporter substrate-binding protein DctP [Deltaproteobacteria bacterium]